MLGVGGGGVGVGGGCCTTGVGVGAGAGGVGGTIGVAGGVGALFTPLFNFASTVSEGITVSTSEVSGVGSGRMNPEQSTATITSKWVLATAIRHFFCSRVIWRSGRCGASSA